MIRCSASRAAFVLALALLATPCFPRAQGTTPASPAQNPAPADATSFATEFEAARTFTTRRMWKAAHAAWLELLRRHAGANHVRARLPEIRELVRKCAFWQVTREPDAKSCVSGKLISYEAGTGRMRILYTPDTLGDFEQEEKLLVHPVHFSGPYTIELEGDPVALSELVLLVGVEGERGCSVNIGLRQKGDLVYSAHQLIAVDGKDVRVLATGELEERTSKKPATVLVSVSPRLVNFRYDGKQVMSAEWESGALGRVAISSSPKFTELLVTGTVDPGWIDGLIDAKVQAERKAFDAKWVDPVEFAAWPEAKPSETQEQAIQRLFGDVTVLENGTKAQAERVQVIARARAEGAQAAAIEALLKLTDEQLPAPARELLIAFCYADLKRPTQVVERLEAHARLATPSFALQYLHAIFLTQVERHDDALVIFERLAKQDQEPQLVSEALAELLLIAGRYDEARAAIERGVERVGSTVELDRLRTRLAKATVGPPWRQTLTHASPHFFVSSDVDTATARLASRTLEEAWMDCQRLLGRQEHPEAPTRAYVFSGRASYDDYIRDIAHDGLENSLGIYSRSVHQIVAWNQLSEADLLLVLRHECVHRYLDLSLGDVPRWYDEGLAEYIAAARSADGTWTDGAVNVGRLEWLRQSNELLELKAFLFLDDEVFMQEAGRNYAEAWAFVHFLRCGRNEAALAFERRLLVELRQRTDTRGAVERALDGLDLPALQTAFVAHIGKLVKAR